MEIYRYKANSMLGYERVTVDDNYQLKASELKELPTPCYTPMKLDASGNLVSATLDESNAYAKTHNNIKASPSTSQQQIMSLTTVVGQLSQQITGLTSLVQAQQQRISKLKGAN